MKIKKSLRVLAVLTAMAALCCTTALAAGGDVSGASYQDKHLHSSFCRAAPQAGRPQAAARAAAFSQPPGQSH